MNATKVSTGEKGFAFERRIGVVLNLLKACMEKEEDWVIIIHTEQGIRDFFNEQSLNGVDHMVQIQEPSGKQHLFLIQEKWKLITNQREVSQFLDCCARILARMPDYKGDIHRMWVSRTVPSANGEKSLHEGQCIVVQTCTSQSLLAFNTALIMCDVIGRSDFRVEITGKIGSLLPCSDEIILDPKADEPTNTFQPISDFGEKRVLPITNKTVVIINKVD